MTDVCLVYLPYGALERPCLAYGLFKATLDQAGIATRVLYANYAFAEQIGTLLYSDMAWVKMEMIGEWSFAGAAFPDFTPDHDAYLERVVQTYSPGNAREAARIKDAFWSIRRQAASFIDRTVERVLDLRPRIVACSSMFNQHCAVLAFCRRLKELAPQVVTVVGGANCEAEMGLATIRHFPWLDFVVSGEADQTFPALCRLILDRGANLPPGDLPEAVFSVHHRGDPAWPGAAPAPRAALRNLDGCPTPDFDDFFAALSAYAGRDQVTPGLLIETSRGCWWGEIQHCTFCGLNGGGMAFRSKAPERVVAELTHLAARYGVHRFLVVDNILDKRYFDTVLPALARSPVKFQLFYEIKANVTYAQLQALKAAGASWLQPGIESLHDDALRLMRKGTKAWINVQLLKWARELGQSVAWNILCGFPGEEDGWFADMADWLPLLEHLQPCSEIRPIRFDRFSPHHTHAAEYGLALRPAWPYAFIYPLQEAELARLVYVFEAQDRPAHQTSPFRIRHQAQYPSLGGPGKDALQALVRSWHGRFVAVLPALLCMTERRDSTLILDTRKLAPSRQVTLEGLVHRVHRACDEAAPAETIRRRVEGDGGGPAGDGEVEAALADLVARKLVVRLGGRYLALAVRGDVPPLAWRLEDGYPGGWVDRRRRNRTPDRVALASRGR